MKNAQTKRGTSYRTLIKAHAEFCQVARKERFLWTPKHPRNVLLPIIEVSQGDIWQWIWNIAQIPTFQFAPIKLEIFCLLSFADMHIFVWSMRYFYAAHFHLSEKYIEVSG